MSRTLPHWIGFSFVCFLGSCASDPSNPGGNDSGSHLTDAPSNSDGSGDGAGGGSDGSPDADELCLGIRVACTDTTECCGQTSCRVSPVDSVCCGEAGRACVDNRDCCGWMLCTQTGTCACN